jgi:hypothetical protein
MRYIKTIKRANVVIKLIEEINADDVIITGSIEP